MYQAAEEKVRLHQAELRADAEASRCGRMARRARGRGTGRLRPLGRRRAGHRA